MAIKNSLFDTFAFDWAYGGPRDETVDGARRLVGQGYVYDQADYDGLLALRRPCTVRAAGDPTAGGTVYVDHWGPDPSKTLLWQGWSATAILTEFKRSQHVHFTDVVAGAPAIKPFYTCDFEFLLLTDPVVPSP